MHGSKLPTLAAILLFLVPVSLQASVSAPSEATLIEAENYSAMSGIQTQSTSDSGGGSNVAWMDVGDWLRYDVALAAGEYQLKYRVSGFSSGDRFELRDSETSAILGTVSFDSTGGWQNWTTVDTTVELGGAVNSIELLALDGDWNINWLEVTPLSQNSSSSAPSSSSSSESSVVSSSDAQSSSSYVSSSQSSVMQASSSAALKSSSAASSSPSSSAPKSSSSSSSFSSQSGEDFQLRIEAEDFTDMSGVQVEATEDIGGGGAIGWVDAGDWVQYQIEVPVSGTYMTKFRVSGHGGMLDRFRVESTNTSEVSSIVAFEGTGNWQSWVTVEQSIEIPAGISTIQIYALDGDWNINWFELVQLSDDTSSSSQEQSSSFSAESFSSAASSTSYSSSSSASSVSSFHVTSQVSAGGVVDPEELFAESGIAAQFSVSAEEGYVIKAVSGCGGELTGSVYNIPAVTESCTIAATFELDYDDPDGDLIANRYQVDENDSGNIIDLHTGLEWKRCPEGASWDGSGCSAASEYEYQELEEMILEAGWRLPTKEELGTLVFCTGEEKEWPNGLSGCTYYKYPTLHPIAFPESQSSSHYWSKTPSTNVNDAFWAVSFSLGREAEIDEEQYDIFGEIESYSTAYVRLVRGGIRDQYEVSLKKVGEGNGEIVVGQGGVDCKDECMVDLQVGDQLEVLAVAAPGSVFARWSGGCRSTEEICVIKSGMRQEVHAHFIVDRYEFPRPNVVLDKKTGLEWQRCTYGQSWNGLTCEGEAERDGLGLEDRKFPGGWRLPTNNENASIVYCDSGSPSFEGGYRSPCHDGFTSPTIAPWAFPNTLKSNYWSSSTHAGRTLFRSFKHGNAWSLSFVTLEPFRLVRDSVPPESVKVDVTFTGPGSGAVLLNDDTCESDCVVSYSGINSLSILAEPKQGSEFYKWDGLCSGHESLCEVTNWHETDWVKAIFVDDRYQVRGTNGSVVYDSTTDLEWQRCSYGQEWDGDDCVGDIVPLTYSEANSIASEMGWRVPSLEELRTLLFCSSGNEQYWGRYAEYCHSLNNDGPTIVETYFPRTGRDDYLTRAYIPGDGWTASKYRSVSFSDGKNGVVYSGRKGSVRFVRGGAGYPKKTLTLKISGPGEGRVSVTPGEPGRCEDEECQVEVPEGADVTLSHNRDYGSQFWKWGEGCSSYADECYFIMSGDREVEVFFRLADPPLTACSVKDVSSDLSYTEINPEEDIPWTDQRYMNVRTIASAFNYARFLDPSVHTYLEMPSQSEWNEFTLQEKGLYLVNAERTSRGLKPYSGRDFSIQQVAQEYADYMLTNNQIIGHFNDGKTPVQRMHEDDYVAENADGFIRKTESVYSLQDENLVSEEYVLVRAIYGWLYEDKEWYKGFGLSSGDEWGHREHLLQPGLHENHNSPESEGVLGFGLAVGSYQSETGGSSMYRGVAVFNTIDQGELWDNERIDSIDVSGSHGCVSHSVGVSNNYTIRNGLERIIISPSVVHLVEGESEDLQITGIYEDGTRKDLVDYVWSHGRQYSVLNLDDGVLTGLRPGYATIYAEADSVESNRVLVTVGEGFDVAGLAGTGAGWVAPYLADNATNPASLPAMEENKIEADFDPGAISVYTGTVQDRHGVPLSGVHISFLHARNYGSVVTDVDGRFVVAGPAGEQTLVYEKADHLIVQRSAIGASSQWVSVDSVTLLPRDSKTTSIDLSSGAAQVHESSVISDEFGARKATVVFNDITSAVIRSADGTERSVEQFDFSATEFETPSSMPGELPRETAFTWASDLHVDGTHYTDTVVFDGSVVMFVDNFLNFEVGEIVPIGYFDRRVSEWKTSSNGVVVQLIDSNGDGTVDGLDYTGDGEPDDLNGNGATEDDAIGLGSYSAGETLWWGSFNHMTPFDYNWGVGDEEAPGEVDPEIGEEDEYDEECVATGSYVKPYQQSFHEDIEIAGTNVSLHYSSQRTQGYHHKIKVNLSGEDLPATVVKMIARVEIAGRVFEQRFDPQLNLEAEFVWDGTHPDGTVAEGLVSGRVSVGYEHVVSYLSAGNAAVEGRGLSEFPLAWAVQGEAETAVSSRENFTAWQHRGITIKNTYDTQLAEGWSLSSVHEFDPRGKVYLGNGSVQAVASQSLILRTGQTYSHVNGDDGYYQAGGKGIDYTINSDNVLVDLVTGLEWQNVDNPERFVEKSEAEQYCSNLSLAKQEDWRLPTAKEVGYTIDKSSGDAVRRIHSLSRARNMWRATTNNVDQREFAAVCVRGQSLDEANVEALERNATEQVVIDKDNGLMWQDSADNASVTVDWLGSIDYCEVSQHAGYDDWRLPNINELLHTLPNDVFQHQTTFPSDTLWSPSAPERNPYWGSTTNIANEDQAWAMESNGFNSERFDKLDHYHVRCVREDSTASRMPFRFNGDGQHTATIDITSGVELSTFEYDEAGRVIKVKDRFDNTLTIVRNSEGTPVRIEAPDGEITELSINQFGNLKEVRYQDDTYYEFDYGNDGLLTKKIDPRQNVYNRDYDALGRLELASDPEGGFWELFDENLGDGLQRYGYNTAELNQYETVRRTTETGDTEITTTDKSGVETTLVRSADELTETVSAYGMSTVIDKVLDEKTQRPRVETITVTTPDGLVNTSTIDKAYAENGADTSAYTVTTTVNGKESVASVDSRTGVTQTTSPEGRINTVYSDPETLLVKRVETPGLNDREYDYDWRGRLLEERFGSRSTNYVYDELSPYGRLDKIVDAKQQETVFEYDLLGRITKVIYPDGNSTVTTYDANGNAETVTVPTQEVHETSFNGVNKVETEDRPDLAPASYTYNLERQLTGIELPSGETISYVYENGRLDRVETPEGQTSYHYQQGDQLLRMERGTEKVHYEYDGTLLTKQRYEGLLNAEIGYDHNNDFMVDNLSYAGGSTALGYDDDGLITAINGFELIYKPDSGFLDEVKNSQFSQDWEWNAYGEPSSVNYTQAGQTTFAYDLEYNVLGQITDKTEQRPGGGVDHYEYFYDERDRLEEVQKNGVIVEAYAYNANGNRMLQTSTELGVEAESATYTAGDQLDTRGSTTYGYDANGRLSQKLEQADSGLQQTDYVYGSQGQLLQVDTPEQLIEYRHNALGQRVAKLVNGQVVEHYLWQDLTTLLATYDGSGNLKQRFEYTAGHTPTSFTQDGQRYYIQTDHLGSPRVITDNSGSVVRAIRYDSYGNIVEDTNPSFEIPFGFSGGLHDADTGLIRFGYRDFDPYTGRWTARDPIGFGGGDTNLYGYVLNDPVNFYDLNGLELTAVDRAALNAVQNRRYTSISGNEVGGRVMQSWFNHSSVDTSTVRGTNESVRPMSAPFKLFHNTVATWHTHPDGSQNNYFSKQDVWSAELRQLVTYVSGDSRVLKYDPVTGVFYEYNTETNDFEPSSIEGCVR